MARYTLGELQNGTALSLRIGDVVVLRLREDPVTGQRWDIVSAPGFVLEADDFIRSDAGGERALRFKATVEGAARIDIALRRNSEIASPQSAFSITAEVRRGLPG